MTIYHSGQNPCQFGERIIERRKAYLYQVDRVARSYAAFKHLRTEPSGFLTDTARMRGYSTLSAEVERYLGSSTGSCASYGPVIPSTTLPSLDAPVVAPARARILF